VYNGKSCNEPVVTIRIYAILKPTAIPNTTDNMDFLPTGGLDRPETINSMFQAQQ
jgi:hypothetical protein